MQINSPSPVDIGYNEFSIRHQANNRSLYYSNTKIIAFYFLLTIVGPAFILIAFHFLSFLSPWDWKGSIKQLWGATLYTFILPIGFMITVYGILGLMLVKQATVKYRVNMLIICSILITPHKFCNNWGQLLQDLRSNTGIFHLCFGYFNIFIIDICQVFIGS